MDAAASRRCLRPGGFEVAVERIDYASQIEPALALDERRQREVLNSNNWHGFDPFRSAVGGQFVVDAEWFGTLSGKLRHAMWGGWLSHALQKQSLDSVSAEVQTGRADAALRLEFCGAEAIQRQPDVFQVPSDLLLGPEKDLPEGIRPQDLAQIVFCDSSFIFAADAGRGARADAEGTELELLTYHIYIDSFSYSLFEHFARADVAD